MSVTIEDPIVRLSFVALANSSSMEADDDAEDIVASLVVLMGVDGGAISIGIIGGDDRLVMIIIKCFHGQSVKILSSSE